jgi:hypothetical protein
MALRFPENTGGCRHSVLHRRSFAPADSARRGGLVGARSAIYLRVQNQLAHFSWLHCQIVLR